MKRIYLLMAAVVGLTTAASAQRSVNIEMTQMYPTGLAVVSADEDPDMQDDAWANNAFSIKIKNLGPDAILATDTAYAGIALFVDYRTTGQYIKVNFGGIGGLAVGSEGFLNYGPDDLSYTYDADQILNSQQKSESLCDTMFLKDQAGAIVPDNDITNNHGCTNVNFNYWFLNVANVNEVNGFNLFPNPAASKLNLVSTFNNAKVANVVIRDVVGKTVLTQNLGTNLNGQQSFVLDINNLATGMYVVDLSVDGNKITRKISVQK